jgi:hypothetical protein
MAGPGERHNDHQGHDFSMVIENAALDVTDLFIVSCQQTDGANALPQKIEGGRWTHHAIQPVGDSIGMGRRDESGRGSHHQGIGWCGR